MHLISVDPWLEDRPENYVDIANVAQWHQDANYESAQKRLAPFGTRSTIWRMTSVEAAARIPAASLDFVYIDARHDYASVMEDLEAWYPKVRPGGLMTGHDYLDGTFDAGEFEVRRAVDEFFSARDLRVFSTLLDGPCVSFIVEVPPPGGPPEVPDV